jgi:hypothetical protein
MMSSWQGNLSWFPFGSGFADVNHYGFTLTWNKTTQELVDADDGEVMGKMVYRPMRGWHAHLFGDLDSDSDGWDSISDDDEDVDTDTTAAAETELTECQCCGNIWDGNAQCNCMCYGCDKCASPAPAAEHPLVRVRTYVRRSTRPTVSARRKARTPMETNTTRNLRQAVRVLTFHGVDADNLARPKSTMHSSLKEPGMFTEFLSGSLVCRGERWFKNKKWCTKDRENFCDNCVLVKNNPKTTIWKCLGH